MCWFVYMVVEKSGLSLILVVLLSLVLGSLMLKEFAIILEILVLFLVNTSDLISISVVFLNCLKMLSRKASGLDGIPCCVLNDGASEINLALSVIFKCLHSGTLSMLLKCAVSTRSSERLKDARAIKDRPICLTSVCCETREDLIYSDIMQHLDCYDILSDSQYGTYKFVMLTTNGFTKVLGYNLTLL